MRDITNPLLRPLFQYQPSPHDPDNILEIDFWSSVASAAGTSTVSGVGASTFAGVASASGTSTVSAVGSSSGGGSTVTADGAASGTSTVSGVGASTAAAAAASSGTSTVSATGASTFAATASAAGTSTVAATGISTAAATAAASGTSTVSGVGATAAAGDGAGSAAGVGTATGVGAALAEAVGAAAAVSTVLGVSDFVAPTVANSEGARGGGSSARQMRAGSAKLRSAKAIDDAVDRILARMQATDAPIEEVTPEAVAVVAAEVRQEAPRVTLFQVETAMARILERLAEIEAANDDEEAAWMLLVA